MSFSFNQLLIQYFRNKKYGKSQSYQELTAIEKKILKEISIGKSYSSIADELMISKEKVQKHIRIIYGKLQDKSCDKND